MEEHGEPIRMCLDRVVPFELDEEAERVAVEENPANTPESTGAKLAVERRKIWLPGRTLKIRFMDGTATQRRRVIEHAMVWTTHANIRFDFEEHAAADIRVSFNFDSGSWSAVGTDALVRGYFPIHEPTMSLGWLKDGTDDKEYSRIVLHEFGHALGCIHEHQNPTGGIRWKTEAVYAYYGRPPNEWSRKEVDIQVLGKYAKDQIMGTGFDPNSIMLYAFPASLVEGGQGTHENTQLSAKDIEFIGSVYPFPKQADHA